METLLFSQCQVNVHEVEHNHQDYTTQIVKQTKATYLNHDFPFLPFLNIFEAGVLKKLDFNKTLWEGEQ